MEPEANRSDRRSFLKWSLLSLSAFAATVGGFGPLLKTRELVQTLTSGPMVTTDASLGSHFRLTAMHDFILCNPHNASDGQRIVWEIIQGPAGNHQLTLDRKFALGSDITVVKPSVLPHKRDFLTAIYNLSADQWHVVGFVKGY